MTVIIEPMICGYLESDASALMEIVRRQHDGTWRFVIDDPYARG